MKKRMCVILRGCLAVMICAMSAMCAEGESSSEGSSAKHESADSVAKSGGRTELRLRLHWVPQSQFAGYLVAIEKGFYHDEGLPSVRIIMGDLGDDPFQQLEDDESDFCTGWLADGVLSRSGGVDVVELAQIFATSSQMFVARADSRIESPADFSGKRVGSWLGNHWILLNLFLEAHDLSVRKIPQTESLVPFLRGAIDVCAATYYNEYHQLMESGLRPKDLRIFALADYGLGFPEDAIFTSRRLWNEDPELCRRFVRASLRGWEYAFKNETETVNIVLHHMKNRQRSNPNHQQWMLRAVHLQFPKDRAQWGQMAPQVYRELCDALMRAGAVREPPPFNDFFVGEPMEEAMSPPSP